MKKYPRSDIFNIPIEDLAVDPARFQYKIVQFDKHGSTNSLKGVKRWDPNLAGSLLVWEDRDQIFIINGHNRYSKALGLGVKTLPCQFIKAKTARSARSIGALKNISEGAGTAIDAAKFFRDSKLDRDQVSRKGLLPDNKLVRDGLTLSQLNDTLFDRLIYDRLSIKDGLIIGSKLPIARQNEIIPVLDNGTTGNDLAEYCELLLLTTEQTVTQTGLFGLSNGFCSDLVDKAKLIAWTKARLSKEKRIFSTVAKNAAELETAGNKINQLSSAGIADRCKQAILLFDQLKLQSGPLSDLINSGLKLDREQYYSQVLESLNQNVLNL